METKGLAQSREYAHAGSVVLALGLLPMIWILDLAAICIDSCSDAPRYPIFFSLICLMPGILLSGIAWFMCIEQSFKHQRPMNYFAAYVLPALFILLLVILTSSLGGNLFYPRTHSANDPWISAWSFLILLIISWSAIVSYWNRPTERPQSTREYQLRRLLRYICLLLLCFYEGYTLQSAAYLFSKIGIYVSDNSFIYATIFFALLTGFFFVIEDVWRSQKPV